MKLLFEKGAEGRPLSILPPCDVPEAPVPEGLRRERPLRLPCLSEVEVTRHYTALSRRCFGVDDGFYPLGSCTMKYNPRVDEQAAALPGFTGIHPLQPAHTAQGCLKLMCLLKERLCAVTGMDDMTLQPAAGAHGEFTGLLLIKAYHEARGDQKRTKIIVPDSAHGTNPASAAMAGFSIVNIPSGADGCVDLAALRAAVGEDTAGLMLTNPNTVGIFDKNILEITRIVHEAGGLCYYDGANLNAVAGVARPGDMGFDVVHLNLHKTFGTPHGGGGPGSGPVGCKAALSQFLPDGVSERTGDGAYALRRPEASIGRVKAYCGNFLVMVRAFAFLTSLGAEGVREMAVNAVLNANYLKHALRGCGAPAYDGLCMHEFVLSLDELKKRTGVSALDVAKGMLDAGMHPPTMYFPLIVHEALMFEPTETESKRSLDEAAAVIRSVFETAEAEPALLHDAPRSMPVRRLDEVKAARAPRTTYYQVEKE